MSAQFDTQKADQLINQLQDIIQTTKDKQPLTNEQIERGTKAVNEYYKHIIQVDPAYGQAAFDVANNIGAFGRFGNKYFETVAQMEGRKVTELPDLAAKFMAGIAYQDALIRSTNEGRATYFKIYDAHKLALEDIGLTEKAWGGSFFYHFMGEGSYLDLGGYDIKVEVEQWKLLKSLATNAKVNGVDAWEYVGILRKVGVENFGDTAASLLYRTALGLNDDSIIQGTGGTIIVRGMSEAQVAAKFNIPVSRVTENQDVLLDKSSIKSFTISSESTDKNTASRSAEQPQSTQPSQDSYQNQNDGPKYTPFPGQKPSAPFAHHPGATNEIPKQSFQQTPIPDYTKPGGQTPIPEFSSMPKPQPAPSASTSSGTGGTYTPPKNEGEFNAFLRNNFGGERPKQTEMPKNDAPRQTPIPDYTKPGGQTLFSNTHQMPNMHKPPEFKWQPPEDYQPNYGSSKQNGWGFSSFFEGTKDWFGSFSSKSSTGSFSSMFGKTGSWSDTFKLPKFNYFSSIFDTQKHSIFNEFKPSYGQYGQESIFKTYNSPYQNNFINEPSWMFKKDMSGEAFFEKWKLKTCLKSGDCRSFQIADIIDRYGKFDPAGKFSLLKDVMREIRNTGSDRDWFNVVKNCLKYAASHVSPLVLDLNGDGVKLVSYTDGVYFDIDNDGFLERVGWPVPEDGQLVRDINHNGKIDDITELFGDDLISAYFKLSLLDTNNDEIIDKKDKEFKELLVWQDANSNGYSEPGELHTLNELKIKSISLYTQMENRVIAGNLISESSKFTFENGTEAEMVDAHYHNDDMDSWYKGKRNEELSQDKNISEITEFRKALFKELLYKVRNPKDLKGDWVADAVKEKTKNFIESYKKKCEDERKALQLEVNQKFGVNANKIGSAHYKMNKKASDEVDALIQKELKKAADLLLVEFKEKAKQESDNIKSALIQKQNDEWKILIAPLEAKLKQMNQQSSAVLMPYHQRNGNQQTFNQAMEAANKQNRDALEKEIEPLRNIIDDKYAKLGAEEIAANTQKYQKEYEDEVAKFGKKLKKDHNKDLRDKSHVKSAEYYSKNEGLKKLYTERLITKQNALEEFLKNITINIKEEANKIYDFFISKVLPKVDHGFANAASLELLFESYLDEDPAYNFNHNKNDDAIKIDPETLLMPLMRGYGKVPSLHIAMTENSELKKLVKDFMQLKVTDSDKFNEKILEILFEWAGIKDINESNKQIPKEINIEPQKVAFVEMITGQEFKQLGVSKSVGQHASTAVQKAWDISLARIMKNLLIQGPFASIFPKAKYSFIEDKVHLNQSFKNIMHKLQKINDADKPEYDFWIQVGHILAANKVELKTSVPEISTKLSELAGRWIFVSEDYFGIIGDEGDNILNGTKSSDYINGLGGHDKLYGKESSDHLEGGEGNDELYGEAGIDRMHGGDGNDKLYGGGYRDFMYGDAGSDELYGEAGDDHMDGGEGADIIDGGEGENTLSYGDSKVGVKVNLATGEVKDGDAEGDKIKNFRNLGGSEFNDVFYGDEQDNHINGEGGDDELHGGKGTDDLFGATGEDHLYGDEGDDNLTGFEGPDHMDGGEGIDTANYAHQYATKGVIVDLKEGVGFAGYAEGDTYKNIENVVGSKFSDIITGDDKDNSINGNDGNDELHGGGGDDNLSGGDGKNNLFGDEGNDTFIFTGGKNLMNGGAGEDAVSYHLSRLGLQLDMEKGTGSISLIHEDHFEEIENVIGTDQNDEIKGDAKNNNLVGLDGDDIIDGRGGDDNIRPGKGKDQIDGGDGSDTVDYSDSKKSGIEINLEKNKVKGGNAEGDTIKNIENVVGTKFNDIITGDAKDNRLFGLDGDDVIHGAGGNDIISGGKGKNKLYGDSGFNHFIIGQGENFVSGGESGSHYVDYSNAEAGVEVNLNEKTGKKQTGEVDSFESIGSVVGSRFNDAIIGDDNGNNLKGGEGDDTIDGGGWSDHISGGKGKNKLLGGIGNDDFDVAEGSNDIDGGKDIDTLNYSGYLESEYKAEVAKESEFQRKNNALSANQGQQFNLGVLLQKQGLVINLASREVKKPDGNTDKFIGIESVTGTHYDDEITGDDDNNVLTGSGGNDTIKGGKGNDTLTSSRGESKLYGEDGDDTFSVLSGYAHIYGGAGNNALDLRQYTGAVNINLAEKQISYGGSVNYTLEGINGFIVTTAFDDEVRDSQGDDRIESGKGDDKIYLTNGNDSVDGGNGDDTFYLSGSGKKHILGNFGRDIFVISPEFNSQKREDVIIFDFEVMVPADRIDVSSLTNLASIKDVKIEKVIEQDIECTSLNFGQNKDIILYNMEPELLLEEHFIFYKEAEQKAQIVEFA